MITRPSDNAIVWRWDNADPFGANAPNEDPANAGTNFKFNLRFPGQYFDQETGTFYNYYRDYDPATGRYIQSDPIGLDGGLSTFGYVNGNPFRFSDPFGLAAGGASLRPIYPPPQREPSYVNEATKAYLCKLIGECKNSNKELMQCVWEKANKDRKKPSGNGDGRNNWNDPIPREAENFSYAAGWDGWQSSEAAIWFHQKSKILAAPLKMSSAYSEDAYQAGREGSRLQKNTDEDWMKWCDSCAK